MILLFTGEAGEQHGYSDYWADDGTFHYFGEGQSGDMTFVGGNKAIRDHSERGKSLLLFENLKKDPRRVRYRGEFACAGWRYEPNVPDSAGVPRTAIVFQLQPLGPLHEAQISGVAEAETGWSEGKRKVYARSKAVRDAVLKRANGSCEGCKEVAPFERKDGTPYLEPHHIQMISEGGPDTPEWLIALCPNCHRRVHFGIDGDEYNQQFSPDGAK